MAITWEADVDQETGSPSVQLCAYRVAQEALTNALKHSPAAVVAVTLLADDTAADGRPGLRLRVQTTDRLEGGSALPDSPAGSGVGVSGIQA